MKQQYVGLWSVQGKIWLTSDGSIPMNWSIDAIGIARITRDNMVNSGTKGIHVGIFQEDGTPDLSIDPERIESLEQALGQIVLCTDNTIRRLKKIEAKLCNYDCHGYGAGGWQNLGEIYTSQTKELFIGGCVFDSVEAAESERKERERRSWG